MVAFTGLALLWAAYLLTDVSCPLLSGPWTMTVWIKVSLTPS